MAVLWSARYELWLPISGASIDTFERSSTEAAVASADGAKSVVGWAVVVMKRRVALVKTKSLLHIFATIAKLMTTAAFTTIGNLSAHLNYLII